MVRRPDFSLQKERIGNAGGPGILFFTTALMARPTFLRQ